MPDDCRLMAKTMYKLQTTFEIRQELSRQWAHGKYIVDKSGCKMVELIGANFLADEETLFGKIDYKYIQKELDWYNSMSLDISVMGSPPTEWIKSADSQGFVNSNYGWAIYSLENYEQFMHVVNELGAHRDSRRAIMIYTRPNMWEDYNKNGRSDFMCTNTVQYLIRDDQLCALVNMRSNDAVYGYKNDLAWQKIVLGNLCEVFNSRSDVEYVEMGDVIWNVGSLHVYERHFQLLDYFIKTGDYQPSKEELEYFYATRK